MFLATLLLLIGCATDSESAPAEPKPARARFLRQVDWIENGVWLKADLHIHTKFSDGGVPLADVVKQGVSHGCDVLAITDHADTELDAATAAYFQAIEDAQREHPELILLTGLEWNVPPHDGREHATLLVPAGLRQREMLSQFKVLFDDWKRPPEQRDPAKALHALRWLEAGAKEHGETAPVVFYNHPSRKREESLSLVDELRSWRSRNAIAVGFEGSPGHQEMKEIGAYEKKLKTIDRWDPAVANIGDAWDQLLQQGHDLWAAFANSDFHNASPTAQDDYWPGQFSETWILSADRKPESILEALRAGTFFAGHGHIARQVRLQVSATDLTRPAEAGESIEVLPDSTVEVSVNLEVPESDWQGSPNQIDEIEVIAITSAGATVIHSTKPQSGSTPKYTYHVPDDGAVLRARGRRTLDESPDLLFYTNPVRIAVKKGD